MSEPHRVDSPHDSQRLLDAVAAELSRTERPLPLSTLGTRLRRAGITVKNQELPSLLGRLARDGRAFVHPVARRGAHATPCFWRRPASEYVEDVLRRAIAGGGEWTLAQLRRLVPKAYHDLLDETLGRLLSAGELFEAPPTGKSPKLRTSAPRPSDALGPAQMRSLHTILQRVNLVRRPALTVEELLALLDGGGEPAPHARPRTATSFGSPPIAPAPSADPLTEVLLLRFYDEDLPRREGLRSMPIPWTWRRYQAHCRGGGSVADARRLGALLTELAAVGRVALAVHDAPSTLPAEDLEVLPREEDGRVIYYWTPLGRGPA